MGREVGNCLKMVGPWRWGEAEGCSRPSGRSPPRSGEGRAGSGAWRLRGGRDAAGTGGAPCEKAPAVIMESDQPEGIRSANKRSTWRARVGGGLCGAGMVYFLGWNSVRSGIVALFQQKGNGGS